MKLKSATRFTLFSTLLMTAVNLIFFLFVFIYISTYFKIEIEELTAFFLLAIIILVAGTAFVSYLISSLVVDRILNPVRSMTGKVKDIGERHFTERLVIDSDEDELVEYASAFNEMTLKIHSYIEKQKRFVSDASHELSTPITIINGNADMLLRWGKDDTALLDDSLAVIKNEALRMNELVENLLFFARSDSKRQEYHFTTVNLNELISEAVEEAARIYNGCKFEFICDHPLPDRSLTAFSCDADALKRVFRILFDNAVKHGSGTNRVVVHVEEINGNGVKITVSDHGPGIPAEHLERIFDRFYRVDESRAAGGSGLGLAIAKEIIERHGGTIRAENGGGQDAGGAVFVIEL